MLPRSPSPSAASVASWLVVALAASCGGDGADPGPAALQGERLPPRLAFVDGDPELPLDVLAVDAAPEEYAAAAAAPPAGRGEPVPVAVDRDLRPAFRAVPGRAFALAVASGSDGPRADAEIVIDAVAVPRVAEEARPLALTFERGDVALEPLEVPTRWTTLSLGAADSLDGLRLSREAGTEKDAILLVANARIVDRAANPPAVVLITSDTHRADYVSAIDPSSPAATPHIDALASEGALFTNCLTAINNTNPSHVALLTGVHPRDTKIIDNGTRLHRTAETLAERFRDAGYQTYAALSAFHLFDDISGLGQGFDRMSAPLVPQRDGAITLEIATRWLEDAAGSPLFLWLHLFDAHTPYELPEAEFERVLRGRPDPYRDDVDLGIPDDRVPPWLAATGIRDPEFVNALYAGEVAYLDGQLGAFFALPRVAGSTMAFTADHGEGLGEREVFWDHFGLRDPTIRVPLVLRGPGATAKAVSGAPVRQIDIGRTLLDMAGLEDAAFPGVDLRDSLSVLPPSTPRYALGGMGMEASIESEGWLLEMFLREADVGSSGYVHPLGRVFLYHRPTDPNCATDRLLDEFERAKRMRAALVDWLGRAEATGLNSMNQDLPPEALAKLAQLGYTTKTYEARFSWWTPEARDPEWETNLWNVAFGPDGGVEVAARAVEADLAREGR
ncbi:MAG: sulfatase [Planctomycetota bacterium]